MNMRPSDFYEREAEGKRDSLAQTLAALNERLTVGQVIDEVLTYTKGASGTFQSAISNAARDNPMPTLLIGTACALLMADKAGLSTRIAQSFKNKNGGQASLPDQRRENGLVKRAVKTVSDTVETATQRAREAMHDTRDTMSQSMASVSNSASSVKGQMDEMAGHAVTAARRTKDNAARFFDEQPLLLAGVGLALGAIVAFLLPRSRIEDRVMGESSDAIRGEMTDKLGAQLGAVKSAAQDVVEKVKDTIEEEGLSPATVAADALRNLTREGQSEGLEESLGSIPMKEDDEPGNSLPTERRV